MASAFVPRAASEPNGPSTQTRSQFKLLNMWTEMEAELRLIAQQVVRSGFKRVRCFAGDAAVTLLLAFLRGREEQRFRRADRGHAVRIGQILMQQHVFEAYPSPGTFADSSLQLYKFCPPATAAAATNDSAAADGSAAAENVARRGLKRQTTSFSSDVDDVSSGTAAEADNVLEFRAKRRAPLRRPNGISRASISNSMKRGTRGARDLLRAANSKLRGPSKLAAVQEADLPYAAPIPREFPTPLRHLMRGRRSAVGPAGSDSPLSQVPSPSLLRPLQGAGAAVNAGMDAPAAVPWACGGLDGVADAAAVREYLGKHAALVHLRGLLDARLTGGGDGCGGLAAAEEGGNSGTLGSSLHRFGQRLSLKSLKASRGEARLGCLLGLSLPDKPPLWLTVVVRGIEDHLIQAQKFQSITVFGPREETVVLESHDACLFAVKRFLEKLPTPIIPPSLFESIQKASDLVRTGDDNTAAVLRCVVSLLPSRSRETLKFLFKHWGRLAENHERTSLTAHTIAVRVAGCLIRGRKAQSTACVPAIMALVQDASLFAEEREVSIGQDRRLIELSRNLEWRDAWPVRSPLGSATVDQATHDFLMALLPMGEDQSHA